VSNLSAQSKPWLPRDQSMRRRLCTTLPLATMKGNRRRIVKGEQLRWEAIEIMYHPRLLHGGDSRPIDEEEKKIRQDLAGSGKTILTKVFGALRSVAPRGPPISLQSRPLASAGTPLAVCRWNGLRRKCKLGHEHRACSGQYESLDVLVLESWQTSATKKLAGAAKTSFVKKCEVDAKAAGATAACETQAKDKKLAGAAERSRWRGQLHQHRRDSHLQLFGPSSLSAPDRLPDVWQSPRLAQDGSTAHRITRELATLLSTRLHLA
jgi:hypothetical protein